MFHATRSSSLTLKDVIRRAHYNYDRKCADIVEDAAVFLDAYKATPNGYLREWLKARWIELRELEAHRMALDAMDEYVSNEPDYEKLERSEAMRKVTGMIQAEEAQAARHLQAYPAAAHAGEVDSWRHSILAFAAQRAQHCHEKILRMLQTTEKKEKKKIKSKTVKKLRDCLREARNEEQGKFREANSKTYRDITSPPPALPHTELALDNFSDTFSQMGLTAPDENAGSQRPESRNSRRSQHGQGATEEPETHRAGGVHFTSPQWSISTTCFHPVSRRSYGTL